MASPRVLLDLAMRQIVFPVNTISNLHMHTQETHITTKKKKASMEQYFKCSQSHLISPFLNMIGQLLIIIGLFSVTAALTQALYIKWAYFSTFQNLYRDFYEGYTTKIALKMCARITIMCVIDTVTFPVRCSAFMVGICQVSYEVKAIFVQIFHYVKVFRRDSFVVSWYDMTSCIFVCLKERRKKKGW